MTNMSTEKLLKGENLTVSHHVFRKLRVVQLREKVNTNSRAMTNVQLHEHVSWVMLTADILPLYISSKKNLKCGPGETLT